MQSLNLDEPTVGPEKRVGFWKRQFQQTPTPAQKKFDWAFGVVIPTLCVLFDPVVFRGNALGTALLGNYKPFAYVLGFVSILGMAAWLLWGEKLRWANSFLGGLFLVGAAVSLAVGFMILPVSLLGLIILIGALGFTPLFAGVVYLRNGVRALRSASETMGKPTLVHTAALSALLSFVVPFTINAEIRASLDAIKSGDITTVNREAAKLRLVAPLVNFDIMAKECYPLSRKGLDTPEYQAVDDLYHEMTGNRMEQRMRYFD